MATTTTIRSIHPSIHPHATHTRNATHTQRGRKNFFQQHEKQKQLKKIQFGFVYIKCIRNAHKRCDFHSHYHVLLCEFDCFGTKASRQRFFSFFFFIYSLVRILSKWKWETTHWKLFRGFSFEFCQCVCQSAFNINLFKLFIFEKDKKEEKKMTLSSATNRLIKWLVFIRVAIVWISFKLIASSMVAKWGLDSIFVFSLHGTLYFKRK